MFVGWHNSEIVALPQRDCRALYSGEPETWRRYELAKLIGVPNSEVFSHLFEAHMNDTSAEHKLIGQVAEVEISALALESFLHAFRTGPMKKLSFSRLDVTCKGTGVLIQVLSGNAQEWFDLDILVLLDPMNVNCVIAFIAVVRVDGVDWSALGSQDWFPYVYDTGKLIFI